MTRQGRVSEDDAHLVILQDLTDLTRHSRVAQLAIMAIDGLSIFLASVGIFLSPDGALTS